MSSLKKLAKRFLSDQHGAEITEVGLYLALIVAACVALMGPIGTAVFNGWNTVKTAVAP